MSHELDDEPLELRAGLTWSWLRDLPDYPAPTWTLTYYFKNATNTYDVAATNEGGKHRFTRTAAQSASMAAGLYSWVAVVSDGTIKHEVDSGTLTILKDFTAAGAYDDRLFPQKMLDAIEAALLGRATDSELDLISVTIGQRAQQRNVEVLLPLRDKFKAEVARLSGKPLRAYVRLDRV